MGDVDKFQVAEEAAMQRAEAAQRKQRETHAAELREQPLRNTARKGRHVVAVGLHQVHPGDNIRTDLPEIQELALSIRELGLLTPLIVRPWDDAPKVDGALPTHADAGIAHFRLVAGHRRHAALLALREAGVEGHEPVQCEVREGLSVSEAYALMLTENVQRVPLEPIQAARALRLLMDLNEGMSVAALARWLGLRPAWAQLHLKLLDLPQEVQDRVEGGDLSITVADLLRRAQATGRIDEGKVLDLARKAAAGEITSTQVRTETGPPPRPNTLAPKTVQLGPDGQPVEPVASADGRPQRTPTEPREAASWPKAVETTGAARLSAPPHPGAERMARAERDRAPEPAATVGESLAIKLDNYLLSRAMYEWATDDYLDTLGIDREQVDAWSAALHPDERIAALRHLSLALMQADMAPVGA